VVFIDCGLTSREEAMVLDLAVRLNNALERTGKC